MKLEQKGNIWSIYANGIRKEMEVIFHTLKNSLRGALLRVSGSATAAQICRNYDLRKCWRIRREIIDPEREMHKQRIRSINKSTFSISSKRAVFKYSSGVYIDNQKRDRDSALKMHSKNGAQGAWNLVSRNLWAQVHTFEWSRRTNSSVFLRGLNKRFKTWIQEIIDYHISASNYVGCNTQCYTLG